MSKFIPWETKVKIVDLYCDTNLNLGQIANLIGLCHLTVTRIVKNYLSKDEFNTLVKEKRRSARGINLPEKGIKRCSLCFRYLKLSEYYYSSSNPVHRYQNYCKDCSRDYCNSIHKKRRTKIEVRYREYQFDAKRNNRHFSLTMDDFLELWNQPCCYCGDPIEGIGLDRVDNSQGYYKSNVVNCCKYCNYSKHGRTQEEFINHCLRIVEYSIYRKNKNG